MRLPATLQRQTGCVNVFFVPTTSAEKLCRCCRSPTQTPPSPSSPWQLSPPVKPVQLRFLLPSPDEWHAGNLHLDIEKSVWRSGLDFWKIKNLERIKLSFCAYRTNTCSTYQALPCWCKHSPSPSEFGERPLESKAVPAAPLCPRQQTNRSHHFWCFQLWYRTTGTFFEMVLQGFISSSFRYLRASPAEAQELSPEICRELSRSEAYHWCDPGDPEQCDGIPGIPN